MADMRAPRQYSRKTAEEAGIQPQASVAFRAESLLP
jgi:hypothetical protein